MIDPRAASYLEAQVASAPPLKIVRLMYDGALASLRIAAARCQEGKRSECLTSLKKAQALLGELHASLDFERGGEVAAQLDRVYEWAQREMLDATLKPDAKKLHDLIRVIETLQDGWNRIRDEHPAAPGA